MLLFGCCCGVASGVAVCVLMVFLLFVSVAIVGSFVLVVAVVCVCC